MRASSNTISVLFLCLTLLTSVQAADGVEILYKEALQQMQMAYATLPGERQARPESARELRFDAFGKRFDIRLEVNRTLLTPLQRERLDERYEIYRGEISGMPNSWVRLVIADGVPRGMLYDGSELMAVDVTSDGGADHSFIYRLSDLQIPAGLLACSDIGNAKSAAELASAVIAEVGANAEQAVAAGADSQIDVAVIGDFEFTSANDADAIAELTTRMNNVDGIFSMQLGVHLNVTRIDTYAVNNDPFSNARVAGDLLDELTDYRFATPAQYDNGLTHLFTGRNLAQNTVGIAYTGALCSRRFGAGLTEVSDDPIIDSLVAAHEIGHNFGAPHDGTSGSTCEDVPQTFLMAPQVNGNSNFSSCSISAMRDDVSRASCVSAMPVTDVAIVAMGPSTMLYGNSETLRFEANNVGTTDASGVTVDIAVPAGVTLSSVSTTDGNCTSGAGTVSCALGTIATGSGVTVSIDVAPSSVGSFEFASSIAATSDADPDNNQAALLLTVEPAVDLVSTAAATPQIELNASTTLNASVENRATIVATGVTLTVAPQTGLTIDSVTWSAGSCNLANNVATCQANSLAAESNSTLQLGVTGSSAGTRSYTITASAVEADRQPSDNQASGQVAIGSAPGEDPDGAEESGAGSFGWFSLLLLLLARGLTFRRAGS